jgi:hypothetical protein
MKALRAISAILLALLVLVSSTSFMVGFHFCMGEVKSVALFTEAESCKKQQSLPACHRPMKAPCCADETYFHEGDDFKASVEHIHVGTPAPIDLDQPLVLISEVIPSTPAARIQYYNYDPPLRSCDLTVEHQVFLI